MCVCVCVCVCVIVDVHFFVNTLLCSAALRGPDEVCDSQEPSAPASRMETDLDEEEADLTQKQVALGHRSLHYSALRNMDIFRRGFHILIGPRTYL